MQLEESSRSARTKCLIWTTVHREVRKQFRIDEFAPGRTGHGNDRVWKARKAIKPASHPSHTLWKSLRDYHIPTPRRRERDSEARAKTSHKPKLKPLAPQGSCNGCPRSNM